MKRFLLVAVVWLAGCGGGGFHEAGDTGLTNGGGATPGGVQDIHLVREYVARGVIPPPEAFLVEGMLSEHDLPLDGDACASALCLRGALGWEDEAGWIQIGLSSNVDPETFERPSSAIALLVDVSGSMGWDYGEAGRPAQVAYDLLTALIPEFGAGDAIGIAAFASEAHLVQDFLPGDQHPVLQGKIDELSAGGSTAMEAGLLLVQSMFRQAESPLESRRVLLLTDAQPNVGATSPGSFLEIAGSLASEGIGLTVIGTGIGLNPAVMQSLINLRGGNGFSVASADRVPPFLEDHWPWMVCPVAHDLRVEVAPSGGFLVAEGYGFPGEAAELVAATVFLSRRRGALLIRLEGGPFESLGATLDLRYTGPTGQPSSESLPLQLPGGAIPDDDGLYFEQHGVRKATALALLVDGMRRAAVLYEEQWEEAVSTMEAAAQRWHRDAGAMLDLGEGEDIDRETRLADELLRLMRERAPQESLYGR